MPKKRQQRRPRAVQPKRIAWGPSANPALTEAILAVVDQQMQDNSPPETQRTFERLVALGYAPTLHPDRRITFQEILGIERLRLGNRVLVCVPMGDEDAIQPMPIVFNLSLWALRRRSLAVWLIDELNERYDVPRHIGQAWVETDQVLPLLDGLDEVKAEERTAGVDAINAFRRTHGLVGMVVCSRSDDYAALTHQLKLQGAVGIQPLTPAQVGTYLAQAGEHLAGLRVAVAQDAVLQELAHTPLLLTIMTLAYQGVPVAALADRRLVADGTTRRRGRWLVWWGLCTTRGKLPAYMAHGPKPIPWSPHSRIDLCAGCCVQHGDDRLYLAAC